MRALALLKAEFDASSWTDRSVIDSFEVLVTIPLTVTVVFAVAHCGVMPVIATLTGDALPSVFAVAWVFAAARAGLAVAARAGASAAGSVTAPTVTAAAMAKRAFVKPCLTRRSLSC